MAQHREPFLGDTNKRPFLWSLKDDACFMLSGLKKLISDFFQQTNVSLNDFVKNSSFLENILTNVKFKGQLFLVFFLLPHA